jgi:hypothetical protein
MSNRQDLEEATKLATSLLERTQDGKIDWSVYDQDEFVYTTPAGIAFVVSAPSQGYGFKMQDRGGQEIITTLINPEKEYWELLDGEAALSKVLPDLYDVARRSALKVEQKVSEISEYLNSL